MTKYFYSLVFLLFFLLTSASLHAQFTLKGRLIDEDGEGLASGTVMIMTQQDSILKGFALTDASGGFVIKFVQKGGYILKGTYPNRININQNIEVSGEEKEIDLGNITVLAEGTELDNVEITDEMIPIRIKGDTIEYAAGAFKTQPNASVEDLLKRLPGMEVDSEGNVKAQGDDVTKVLVDGKEFFGNDPKVATKNLPADAIDKVQVFDKMSDMSDFTGVDDGERSRTINLMLKEDRKNGYFGDISAGYGTKDRFRAKTNLNRFSAKSQFSILGMANNINEQAFSITDYLNFMGGLGNVIQGGGMGGGQSTLSLSPSDLGVSFRGTGSNPSGITTSAAGGINYNVDLGKKTQLTTSYFYNFMRKDLEQFSLRENILSEQVFATLDTTIQQDRNQNHRLNLRLEHEIDSSSKFILTGAGSLSNTNGDEASFLRSLAGGDIENSNIRSELTDGGTQGINTSLLYLKRFKKPGRSLALQGTLGYSGQLKDQQITAFNSFFPDGQNLVTDTLSQEQEQSQGTFDYGGKVTYTEPIGRFKFLEGFYAHQENANDLVKDFFDVQTGVRELDSLLSNRYDGGYSYDQGGLNFRYTRKKFTLTAGLAGQRSALDGVIGLQDTTISKEFLNVLPSIRLRYSPKQGTRLRVNYGTQVNAPSIEQLQPVVDNSNPLNLFAGNPDLRAEYTHSLNVSYGFFDQFSFTSMFTGIRATYTHDKISTSTQVDSLLRQFTTFENVDKDIRLTWFAHFSTPIRKLKIKFNLDPTVTYNQGITLINNQENLTDRLTSGVGVSVENRRKEHFDIRVGARYSHNITQYSLERSRNQTFLNSTYFTEMSYYLPKGFTLNTTFNYSIYSGGQIGEAQTVPLWNAYIGKTFLRAERGELRVNAFDLLNQNQGFDRTTAVNYLEESRYNTLSRYFMLSFTYKIVTVGK